VAPHNPSGQLASLHSAHFAASIPNFRILEYRWDEAPWSASFLTHPNEVENGQLVLSDRPGWGSDINEDALKEWPPRPQA
jgi:L-alanine-DL-glutamate epimerase-like enolase superfamily enzyme